MFFGSYSNVTREEYIRQVLKVLSSEEETYKTAGKGHLRPWLGAARRQIPVALLELHFVPGRPGDHLRRVLLNLFMEVKAGVLCDTIPRCPEALAGIDTGLPKVSGGAAPGSATQSGWQK